MAETTTFMDMKKQNDHTELVRKALESVAFVAPKGTKMPETITDDSGKLLALPKEWWGLGIVTPDGYQFEAETTKTEVEGHGYSVPVRVDIDKVPRTITVTALEKYKRQFIELTEGVSLGDVKQKSSGEVVYETPAIVTMGEYCMMIYVRDGREDAQWLLARGYPLVKLGEIPSDSWNNEAMKTPLKFDVLIDTSVGYVQRNYIAGTGPKKYKDILGFAQESVSSVPGSLG